MARKPQENPALDMTPMIDVVFELIIFFVVTIKQEDLFSQLNANRPAPATGKSESSESDTTVTIAIGASGDRSANGVLVYNSREITPRNLTPTSGTSPALPRRRRSSCDAPGTRPTRPLWMCWTYATSTSCSA